MVFSEGCLSIPGIREEVERKSAIKLIFTMRWNLKEESYDGYYGNELFNTNTIILKEYFLPII